MVDATAAIQEDVSYQAIRQKSGIVKTLNDLERR